MVFFVGAYPMSNTNSQTGSVHTEQSQLAVLRRANVLNREFCIYGTTEDPMFLAKDVAEWIEHSDTHKMLTTVDDDEKLTGTIFLSGQKRDCWFLTEAGLYEVLMQSRKAVAKAFKKQVKTILREIRQTGNYVPQPDKSTVALLSKVCKSLDALTLAILNQTAVQKQEAHTIPQIQYQPVYPVPVYDTSSVKKRTVRTVPDKSWYEERPSFTTRSSGHKGQKCFIIHSQTGEKMFFASLREAARFLGLRPYEINRTIANGFRFNNWTMYLED
jgi:prophage antirepressor-like protein